MNIVHDHQAALLLIVLVGIANVESIEVLDLRVMHNVQQRSAELEAIKDKLEQFNSKMSANYVAGTPDKMKELFADDIIRFSFGRKPYFGAEETARQTGSYMDWFDLHFGNLVRYELTVDEFGQLENGMVWAYGKGKGYNSTCNEAAPRSFISYERIFQYDENNDLRLLINALYVHKDYKRYL